MILIKGEKEIKKVSALPLLSSSDPENHYNYNLPNLSDSKSAIYSALQRADTENVIFSPIIYLK